MTRPEARSAALEVHLGDIHAGTLRVVERDHLDFSLAESYLARATRPVLGQRFEDNPHEPYRRRFRLPFFSNLLPEGRLRELVYAAHGLRRTDDVSPLAVLGGDLPGGIRVVSPGDATQDIDETPESSIRPEFALRFSLAGVQLKFSMLKSGRGLTLPAHGRGGDWIVKLPDPRFERVPENEHSMLTWAGAAGIEVPAHELVAVSELEGLPAQAAELAGQALAVKRFDRQGGARVHIEDFAQVFDKYADEKYEDVNYEQVTATVLNMTGDARELIRRLVFNLFIGNADAHLKNWSFLYPDGVTARLSPAYDLVSTVQYISNDGLALNLARNKDFGRVSLNSFRRLARKIGLDEEVVAADIESTAKRIRQAWEDVGPDLPITEGFRERLAEHQARVPLLREIG